MFSLGPPPGVNMVSLTSFVICDVFSARANISDSKEQIEESSCSREGVGDRGEDEDEDEDGDGARLWRMASASSRLSSKARFTPSPAKGV